MWIYRKRNTEFQVGYLLLGLFFVTVQGFPIVSVGVTEAAKSAATYTHYLNGGNDKVKFV